MILYTDDDGLPHFGQVGREYGARSVLKVVGGVGGGLDLHGHPQALQRGQVRRRGPGPEVRVTIFVNFVT